MSGKKKDEVISKQHAVMNNFFIFKLIYKINKSRVISAGVVSFLGYFEWVFFSGFFTRYVVRGLERGQSFRQLLIFVAITVMVELAVSIYISYVNSVVVPLTDTVIYKKLYNILYQKAGNVDLKCFENSDFYNNYTMALDSAEEKARKTIDIIWSIVFGGIAAVVVFFVMSRIDPYTVLFVVFPIIGNFLFGSILNKLTFNRYQEQVPFKRQSDYVNRVIHLADYSKELRLSNVYNLLKHKYEEAVENTISVVGKYSVRSAASFWAYNVFTFTLIFEGVLIYGAYRTIVSKTMPLSELSVLSSLMVAATWILIGFAKALIECFNNGLYIENLRTFLDYKPNIPENYDGILPEKEIHSIEFRNVSFWYKKESPILNKISFKINSKESVALVGHNGAGKSTLIKLLFRFYDPTEGEILVNGHDIREYNLQAYRKLFSAAFQDYKIYAMSIKENIMMRKVTAADSKVVECALKKAGIYDKVMQLPKKMDTMLTKEFDNEGTILSGGQMQKLAVARAFVHDAPIKIFDEPSGALDPIAEYELFKSILDDSKNKMLFLISHRLASVQNVTKVFMMEDGRIIEEGTHMELMEMDGAYADMYRKQAKNYLASDSDETDHNTIFAKRKVTS